MFLSFHPFQNAGYQGLLVGTGLARPSAPKTLWKDLISDFDEHLYGQMNDPNVTRIPSYLPVPEGGELALPLESARSHCLRKFQKTFQGNLSLGLFAAKSDDKRHTLVFLDHPAFVFGGINETGEFVEFRLPKSNQAWAVLEEQKLKSFSLFPKTTRQEEQSIESYDLRKDRFFRFAAVMFEAKSHPIFSFSLEGGLGEI